MSYHYIEEYDISISQDNFKTKLATFNTDVSFNSTWSWETIIQYDNISESYDVNSILRWIPSAGREIMLAINHEMAEDMLDNRVHSTASKIALKWKHAFRF